jgi:hypothetical protein
MDQPVTIEKAIDVTVRIIMGLEDWLNRFGRGAPSNKRRPDQEIALFEEKLAVEKWILKALERRTSAGGMGQ